jgi:hypothetical protein
MARVVEAVVPGMGDRVRVEKIVTRTMAGARRYQELVRCLGRQLPVPSILINGKLAFEITPGEQELKAYLNAMIDFTTNAKP